MVRTKKQTFALHTHTNPQAELFNLSSLNTEKVHICMENENSSTIFFSFEAAVG